MKMYIVMGCNGTIEIQFLQHKHVYMNIINQTTYTYIYIAPLYAITIDN